VATLARTFGIKEFQFYDWFATYSKPTNGPSWPDPFKRERQIYRETIQTYIDEIHRRGGRAWASVQAVGADEADLANPSAGI
jgi:glycosyl hydrolase family 66